ncbi:YlmC/YmxH family sporulation protein [Tissierella pigra]|uniref:YlmC/YmxH family sporulation protein n=1 Tax=Tissierella pigra TaxID=2607614 RepID=A0A6N7XXP6_9FIRM|nr:YlmC/YmxH family sporulation protein [Tissierella pigra]MBU5426782.1 YlmC/YmxH family sporulation protein [Tissierella pigra]MSU01344.1 YlmC/YmxH family sporulation protein [Tissierella pigra]
MFKLSEIREKEIININNGERIGYADDFELNLEEGCIDGIVIGGMGKVLGLFGKNTETIIPWSDIVRIGTDIILVNYKGQLLE